MMRFYKQFMEKMMIVLIHKRHFSGGSLDELARDILDLRFKGSKTEIVHGAAHRIVRGDNYTSLEELEAELVDRFATPSKSGEGDLIEAMVNILQLPYPRNQISQKMLTTLSKAVLRPDELAAARRVRGQELSCAGCGHNFINGEMGSIHWEGDQNAILICTTCYVPQHIRCAKCAESAPLGKKLLALLSSKTRGDCGGHAERSSPAIVGGAEVISEGRTVYHAPPAANPGIATTQTIAAGGINAYENAFRIFAERVDQNRAGPRVAVHPAEQQGGRFAQEIVTRPREYARGYATLGPPTPPTLGEFLADEAVHYVEPHFFDPLPAPPTIPPPDPILLDPEVGGPRETS